MKILFFVLLINLVSFSQAEAAKIARKSMDETCRLNHDKAYCDKEKMENHKKNMMDDMPTHKDKKKMMDNEKNQENKDQDSGKGSD